MNLPYCILLLTGGTGFIGRALLRHWESNPLNRPYKVVAISRNPQAFAQTFPELAGAPWLDLRRGDVTALNSLPRDSFDAVIHAAADSTMGLQLSPLQRYTQIVDGTRHQLDLTVSSRSRRFLLLSSGAVYGSRSANQIDPEESGCNAPDQLNPSNAYGMAKRTAEHLCALGASRAWAGSRHGPMFRVRRQRSAPERSLCHRKFHQRRIMARANSRSRRWNTKKVLYGPTRSGSLAISLTVPCKTRTGLQRRLRRSRYRGRNSTNCQRYARAS